MALGRKQGTGCWTCRLRRKRCDSVRPACGSCKNLEIICYSGEARPPWMDGGPQQKQVSETIKGRIKMNAWLRREKGRITHEDQGMIMVREPVQSSHSEAPSVFPLGRAGDRVVEYVPPLDSIASTISSGYVSLITAGSSVDQSQVSQSSSTAASSTFSPVIVPIGDSPGSSWPAGPAVPLQVELGPVMIYLDYVFPFLFPFYQPSLLETGRQWLLGLLCQNEGIFPPSCQPERLFLLMCSRHARRLSDGGLGQVSGTNGHGLQIDTKYRRSD